MKTFRFLNTKNFQQLPSQKQIMLKDLQSSNEKTISYSQTYNPIHLNQQRIQNKCINLMTKDGKKTKAYSLFKTSLIQVIKLLRHSEIQKPKQSLKQIPSTFQTDTWQKPLILQKSTFLSKINKQELNTKN